MREENRRMCVDSLSWLKEDKNTEVIDDIIVIWDNSLKLFDNRKHVISDQVKDIINHHKKLGSDIIAIVISRGTEEYKCTYGIVPIIIPEKDKYFNDFYHSINIRDDGFDYPHIYFPCIFYLNGKVEKGVRSKCFVSKLDDKDYIISNTILHCYRLLNKEYFE